MPLMTFWCIRNLARQVSPNLRHHYIKTVYGLCISVYCLPSKYWILPLQDHPTLLQLHMTCAGLEVVIEEFLDGEEASFFALIDGRTCIPLASAQVFTERQIQHASA